MTSPLEIVVVSNGPGELATWVYPFVTTLRQQVREGLRVSVVIVPCPHASGQEAGIARRYAGVDRVLPAAEFWHLLRTKTTRSNWDWFAQGVVVFLGGDQLFAVLLAKRLGYRCVLYCEWQARWQGWVDGIGLRRPLPVGKTRAKVAVVGDLMTDVQALALDSLPDVRQQLGVAADAPLVGLMVGSKPNKLKLGVPLSLAIADHLAAAHPPIQCVIPVAPTLTLKTLSCYADPRFNPELKHVEGTTATLIQPSEGLPYLETPRGTKVYLWQQLPNYPLLRQVALCVTTVGANTAELAALNVPMIVLLPAQQLRVQRAHPWDGLAGLLVGLPEIGRQWTALVFWALVAKGLGWRRFWQLWRSPEMDWDLVKQGLGYKAWPNIWAGREIVPELVGPIEPAVVADQIKSLLSHPQKLHQMRQDLRQQVGAAGAAAKLVDLTLQVAGWAASDRECP
ncbi:lipid-A-disaccharide synthase [Thermosynechococcus sp. TG215]|nr:MULTISPECIES: lipid-A-disaccharide synthase [unclassified Thermosynechococcus]WNC53263.1 lipid-A-disaccharide synthase [Thermosynechococcus sp. TG215]WNC58355.1 lipid-A-disaccharide synthase [Thermosynechococcus sp. TG218]